MHENQNCPKKSLRDNTISSIVFQLDEKALCITALSHFCQLNWWSACKASITPATSKAFLPQANLMNLQTKILRSPGPFGPQQLGKNPFYYSFGSWNPYFTISPECLRLLHVRKRGLGGRSGGGAGLGALWDFRACSNWISTGHVHHTSASHIFVFHLRIYLQFLEAAHRTEGDCLCLCYMTITVLHLKSRAKCAKMSRWEAGSLGRQEVRANCSDSDPQWLPQLPWSLPARLGGNKEDKIRPVVVGNYFGPVLYCILD